jgi:hypothetical protein
MVFRTGENPGKMRLFHISPAGENVCLVEFRLLREQDPNQDLIAQKLAHSAVGWFAAFRHFDRYRSVLPPA